MLKCEAVEPDGKSCSRCGQHQLLSAFWAHPKGLYGRHSTCKTCVSRRDRERRLENLEQTRSRNRASHRKAKYGVDPETFDRMWQVQNGRCSICSKPLQLGVRGHAIDHCHATGKVRSLTCVGCNLGIGHFLENPEVMRLAARYVEAHRASP